MVLAGTMFFTSCLNEDNSTPRANTQCIKIVFKAEQSMSVKSAASDKENQVKSIDVYVFDKTSGKLEAMETDIQPSQPVVINGAARVGEITLQVGAGQKQVLALANTTDNFTVLPAIQIGTTTYNDMLKSVTKLNSNSQPTTPFIMSGMSIDADITASEIPVTLERKVAKFNIVNTSAGDENTGFVITSVQVKNTADRTFLFKNGHEELAEETQFIEYQPSPVNGDISFYVYPTPSDNKERQITLDVNGKINGVPYQQSFILQPTVSDSDVPVKANSEYSINLTYTPESKNPIIFQIKQDWENGGSIDHVVVPSPSVEKTEIAFNGKIWMDRNLGATSADFKNDWNNSIGSFFQWGRNTAFSSSGYETVSGPLSAEEATSDANKNKFITKMSGDWLSASDNNLWSTSEKQPCPEGYRLPTNAEMAEIFSPSAVLFNMVNGPLSQSEELTGGSYTNHYFGDNYNKTLYGIKKQGTENAYYMKWEYLKTDNGNAYIKISRWNADASASMTGKSKSEVIDEFAALSSQPQILELPAAGYITGSNGEYSDSKGGYYWTSSTGSAPIAYRSEFTDGKAIMTKDYKSRVSGHSIRCLKK